MLSKKRRHFVNMPNPFARYAEGHPRCHLERSGWVPVATLRRIVLDGSVVRVINLECTFARRPGRFLSEAISAFPLEPRGGARPILRRRGEPRGRAGRLRRRACLASGAFVSHFTRQRARPGIVI